MKNILERTLVILVLWVIFAQAAIAVGDLMALQGTVNITGTGNISVTIWDSASGGSKVYDSGHDFDNAIMNGRYDVMLGSGGSALNLEYGRLYYLDMSVNGQDLDFNGSDRQQFQSSIGTVGSSNIQAGAISSIQILDESLSGIDIANNSVEKNKIDTTGSWLESEIPALSSGWAGTLDASRIIFPLLLNVNNSQYLGGYAASVFLTNDTILSQRIDALNSSAGIKKLGFNTTSELDSRYSQSGGKSGNSTDEIRAAVNGSINYAFTTTQASNVNTTANIKGLGFNTTTELDTRYLVGFTETDPIALSKFPTYANQSQVQSLLTTYRNYSDNSGLPVYNNLSAINMPVYNNISRADLSQGFQQNLSTYRNYSDNNGLPVYNNLSAINMPVYNNLSRGDLNQGLQQNLSTYRNYSDNTGLPVYTNLTGNSYNKGYNSSSINLTDLLDVSGILGFNYTALNSKYLASSVLIQALQGNFSTYENQTLTQSLLSTYENKSLTQSLLSTYRNYSDNSGLPVYNNLSASSLPGYNNLSRGDFNQGLQQNLSTYRNYSDNSGLPVYNNLSAVSLPVYNNISRGDFNQGLQQNLSTYRNYSDNSGLPVYNNLSAASLPGYNNLSRGDLNQGLQQNLSTYRNYTDNSGLPVYNNLSAASLPGYNNLSRGDLNQGLQQNLSTYRNYTDNSGLPVYNNLSAASLPGYNNLSRGDLNQGLQQNLSTYRNYSDNTGLPVYTNLTGNNYNKGYNSSSINLTDLVDVSGSFGFNYTTLNAKYLAGTALSQALQGNLSTYENQSLTQSLLSTYINQTSVQNSNTTIWTAVNSRLINGTKLGNSTAEINAVESDPIAISKFPSYENQSMTQSLLSTYSNQTLVQDSNTSIWSSINLKATIANVQGWLATYANNSDVQGWLSTYANLSIVQDSNNSLWTAFTDTNRSIKTAINNRLINGTKLGNTTDEINAAEADPQVGITTASQYCQGNGTGLNCNATLPVSAQVDAPYMTESGYTHQELTNEVSIPEDAVFWEEFNYPVASYNRFTTAPTVNVADLGIPSSLNFPTAASQGGDGGYIAAGSTVTNTNLFNITQIRYVKTGIKLAATTGRSDMIGAFFSSVSLQMNSSLSGIFFYYNTTVSDNWWVVMANQGTINRINTTIKADTNWHNLTINSSGTQWQMWFDNTLVTTYNKTDTGYPTILVSSLGTWDESRDAVADTLRLNYFYYRMKRGY